MCVMYSITKPKVYAFGGRCHGNVDQIGIHGYRALIGSEFLLSARPTLDPAGPESYTRPRHYKTEGAKYSGYQGTVVHEQDVEPWLLPSRLAPCMVSSAIGV